MKVLVVVHGFPPFAQGGSEIYAEIHARTLAERHGDEVLVLTREQDPSAPEYRVRRQTEGPYAVAWINNTFRRTGSFSETYANDAVTAVAVDLIDDFGPDVAHIHHLTCLSTTLVAALSRRGVPCLYTLHDYWLLCHRGQLLDRELRVCQGPEPDGCHTCLDDTATVGAVGYSFAPAARSAGRWLSPTLRHVVGRAVGEIASLTASPDRLADEARRRLAHMQTVMGTVSQFLAPSEHIRDRFIEFGVAPQRIAYAPYGLDHEPFQDLARSSSEQVRIGFLGSLMASKAPHVLLEAYRGLDPQTATVDIYGDHVAYHGDHSYRQRLTPLLDQRGVRWHGALARDRVPEALAALDVLVVPSVWPENSPFVIQEAFLAGIPVVASRIGGIPELVRDGVNGMLFPPGNAEALRQRLTRLVSEPALLREWHRGLPPVRTIEDDVSNCRQLYAAQLPAASRPTPVRTAAVVLNYATPDDTVLAVRSLLASRRPIDDLIIVDNDPSDDCRQALKPLDDRVTYLKTAHNLGFSGGMNAGIRQALARGAGRVLLANSDVFVPPDCLDKLEHELLATPAAGIVGPVIRMRSHPDRVASLGMSFVSWNGRMRHLGFGSVLNGQMRTATPDAVSGCLMLITREVFEQVGLLDEDYFFSFEDLDLCLRARRKGFATVLAGAASVYHEGARAVGAQSVDRLYYAARNHLLLAQRVSPQPGRLASMTRTLSIVALNVAYGLRFRGGSLPSRLAAVAEGSRDFLRGRFGAR